MSGADDGVGIADEDELAGGGVKDADDLALDVVDVGLGECDEGLVGHERTEREAISAGGVGHGVPDIAGLPPLLPEFFAGEADGGHEMVGAVAGAAGENDAGAERQERRVAVALKGEDIGAGQTTGEVGAVGEGLELDFADDPATAFAFLGLGGEQFEETALHDGKVEGVRSLRAEERLEVAGLVDGEIDVPGLGEDAALKVDFRRE